MDVTWLASYPKSGSTWTCFLLSAYFYQELHSWDAINDVVVTYAKYHGLAQRAGESNDQLWNQLTRLRAAQPPRHDGFPDDLFLKTHQLASSEHPFFERSRKAILIVRNPRDVATSAINYLRLKQQARASDEKKYLEEFCLHQGDPGWKLEKCGSWQEHAESWLNQPRFPVLQVRYEDLHADAATQLERILRFIDAPIDYDCIRRATELASFDNLKRLEMARSCQPPCSRESKRYLINRGEVRNSLASIDAVLDLRFEEVFAKGMRKLGYAA
jgi:hypothetical protein